MYPFNARGGWVIPPNAEVPGNTEIPPWSEIGNNCTLGDHCSLGNNCTLGDHCSLGIGCSLGDRCSLGNWCKLSHYCMLSFHSTLGDHCTLGTGCKLGYGCALGNWCTLGNNCILGDACKPGNSCQIPNPTWRGIKVSRWLTLANVDGSGRMILVLQDEQGKVWAEVGCFFGTLSNFVKKARLEGKHVYVAVVSAVAKSLKELHHALANNAKDEIVSLDLSQSQDSGH